MTEINEIDILAVETIGRMIVMTPIQVTQQNFRHTVLESERPVLLDFWAPWCTYCRRIAPLLDQLAEEVGDHLTVAKLNTDEIPILTQQFGVSVIPTLILFRDGQRSESLVNPPSMDAILDFLEENGVIID